MMKYFFGSLLLVFIIVSLIIIPYFSFRHFMTQEHYTRNDSFNQSTINIISADFNRLKVSNLPQDHEVYMLTGGIGISNPDILTVNSKGNMTFSGHSMEMPIIQVQEFGQTPLLWKMEKGDYGVNISENEKNIPNYSLIPWRNEVTASGYPYYAWKFPYDNGLKQSLFYFRYKNTFIVLSIQTIAGIPIFPSGIINHLVPIDNPILHVTFPK